MEYGLIFHVSVSTITSVEYGQIVHVMRIGKYYCKNMKYRITRKMVPITGRARSFLLVFKNKIERRGRQNKNNRPINLSNVITFSTDFKYTTVGELFCCI